MIGRFTARRAAVAEPAPAADALSAAGLDSVARTVLPESSPEPIAVPSANPLLSDKLLDAKVRLHRRLIEEINLQALEKLPEEEMRGASISKHVHPGRRFGAQLAEGSTTSSPGPRRDGRSRAVGRCSGPEHCRHLITVMNVFRERRGQLAVGVRAQAHRCASSTRSSPPSAPRR
jgi:hypothetical protein